MHGCVGRDKDIHMPIDVNVNMKIDKDIDMCIH